LPLTVIDIFIKLSFCVWILLCIAVSAAGFGGESFLHVPRAAMGMMHAPAKRSGVPERRVEILDHAMP
jgi:hypothetical protein